MKERMMRLGVRWSEHREIRRTNSSGPRVDILTHLHTAGVELKESLITLFVNLDQISEAWNTLKLDIG